MWLPLARPHPVLIDAATGRADRACSPRAHTGASLFRQSVGATGLHDLDWEWRAFQIGYWLRTSAVGHGYAQEAVEAVVPMAFSELRAQRLELRCDPRNDRSRQVAERVGFVLDGRLRKATRTPAGYPRDTLVYSLIDDDRGGVINGAPRANDPSSGTDNHERSVMRIGRSGQTDA